MRFGRYRVDWKNLGLMLLVSYVFAVLTWRWIGGEWVFW